jgi:hypothetical protein
LERQIVYAQNQLIHRQAIIQYWCAHATAMPDSASASLEKVQRHICLMDESLEEIATLMKNRDEIRMRILRKGEKK